MQLSVVVVAGASRAESWAVSGDVKGADPDTVRRLIPAQASIQTRIVPIRVLAGPGHGYTGSRMSTRAGTITTTFVVLVVAVALGSWRSATAVVPDTDVASRRSSLGEELWRRDCSVCHGVDGGGSERGPDLQGVGAAGVHFQVSTGRMPLADPSDRAARGPVTYEPSEVDALVAHAGTIIEGPPVPEVDLAGVDLASGGRAFRTNCASCHQMAGQGGVLTDGRNVPPLGPADPVEVVEAMRTGPNDMPVFPEAVLDEQAANEIAAYVRELDDARDRGGWSLGHWGPVPEGAVAFALGLVPMVLVTRWLGDRNPPPEQEDELS